MGKKLLVADDSVTIQKVIKLALSSEGYEILAVSEGKEAIRAIEEERPDAVLIDIALPGADAYAVKRAINEKPALAGTSFILMASAFEKVDEKAAGDVQFQARLMKPFDPSHLRKIVAQQMEKAEAPPAVPPGAAPDISGVASQGLAEDLPPVGDALPTISYAPASPVTEDEFRLDLGGGTTIEGQSPPPAPDSEDEQKLESDIRNLTESTIKMSGLDEFQWNLDDSRKMKGPSRETTTLEISRPPAGEEKIPEIRPIVTVPPRPIDDGGSNFLTLGLHQGQRAKGPPVPPPRPPGLQPERNLAPVDPVQFNEPTSPLAEAVPTIDLGPMADPFALQPPAGASAAPITRAEIEELIRKDIEAAIEKLAREAVPRIAETVIRREIEKILSES